MWLQAFRLPELDMMSGLVIQEETSTASTIPHWAQNRKSSGISPSKKWEQKMLLPPLTTSLTRLVARSWLTLDTLREPLRCSMLLPRSKTTSQRRSPSSLLWDLLWTYLTLPLPWCSSLLSTLTWLRPPATSWAFTTSSLPTGGWLRSSENYAKSCLLSAP